VAQHQVRSIAGQAGWEAPKAFVDSLVRTLEAAPSPDPLRLDLLVADLLEDRDGKWWLTQVRHWLCFSL